MFYLTILAPERMALIDMMIKLAVDSRTRPTKVTDTPETMG